MGKGTISLPTPRHSTYRATKDCDVDGRAIGKEKRQAGLSASVLHLEVPLFNIRFDGADGKCQVKNLRLDCCNMLLEWDQPIDDDKATHICRTCGR